MVRSESRTLEGLIKMVAMRRVDVAIIDELTARWVIKSSRLNLPPMYFSKKRYDPVGYRLKLTPVKDWADFNQRLGKALGGLRASEQVSQVVQRYR